MRRSAERRLSAGIALVVTLILLAVITFMAVSFLVLSQRQRDSVATSTDQAAALRATETGAQRALAEIMAPIKAFTNQYNFDLRVSTNYISPLGFNRGTPGVPNYANVSYAYYPSGAPITGNDFLQNLTNLLYSPRAPVYVNGDFRYYLDLNRNGRYDTNGFLLNPVNGQSMGFWVGDPEWIGILEKPEYPHSSTNPFVGRFAYLVIPASKTLDQNLIHNYAKANLPVGTSSAMIGYDWFSRNQGVGPWEINLAAFLVDLNTNLWPYFTSLPGGGSTTVNGAVHNGYAYYAVYDVNAPSRNTGEAFNNAVGLMGYRYSSQYKNLLPVAACLGASGAYQFAYNGLDDFGSGPIMTTNGTKASSDAYWLIDPDVSRLATPYPAAYNPYHFFTPEDYFDPTKTAFGLNPNARNLTTNLLVAGADTNRAPAGANANYYYNQNYDRYTFYRLLQQLGTDSAPEPATKLNLNYQNVDLLGRVVPNMATNFIPWNPAQFFTAAATRLLANAGYTVGIGPANLVYTNLATGALQLHIQIWPTNFYTPSVHRLLQLAANIYDATTNAVAPTSGYPYLPSVFRPVFGTSPGVPGVPAGIIYITNYVAVTNASLAGLGPGASPTMRDLNLPRDRAQLLSGNLNNMVWGIPAVVGAKKGLPNFNEFAMETTIQLTRKLEFRRPDNNAAAPVNQTNQMLLLCVSNVFGLEAWNSYVAAYPRHLQVYGAVDVMSTITTTNNQFPLGTVLMSNAVLRPLAGAGSAQYYVGNTIVSNLALTTLPAIDIPARTWPGYTANGAFKVPLNPAANSYVALDGTYDEKLGQFINLTTSFERGLAFPIPSPHWWLSLHSRLLFILVDINVSPNRIVDYVNLDALEPPLDIIAMAQTNGLCEANYIPDGGPGSLWCTNRAVPNSALSPPYGVLNQIGISLGSIQPDVNAGRWNNAANGNSSASSTENAINFFRNQLYNIAPAKTNVFYTPYEPTRTIYYETSWQANDPLVHYTVPDLTSPAQATNAVQVDMRGVASTLSNLGRMNGRYQPWGSPPGQTYSGNVLDTYNLALKDPMITKSDDWNFPAYKMPNPGWLGRVHRGTPWQTIYLKSTPVDYPHWLQWSGNSQIVTNWGQITPSLVNFYDRTHPRIYQPYALTYDALFTHPTNDYYLVDLFTTALDDNLSRGKMSINQSGLAAWSAVLSGVNVLRSNNVDFIIQPAGAYLPPTQPPKVTLVNLDGPIGPPGAGPQPPLVTLVNAINNVRATNFVGGAFPRLGDILKVPELTVNSPFIARIGGVIATNMNDSVYERIPQQIFGLLKGGEQPRFVIYAYGQALKPANNSTVVSGAYSGLCTNYQITAEAATRTVVRIDGAPLAPRAVIESFSALPPDN